MVAAKYLYPNANMVFSGNLNSNVQEVYNLFKGFIQISRASEINLDKIKKIILVDSDNIKKCGKFSEINKDLEIVIFDHHMDNTAVFYECEKVQIYKEKYGANTTLILKKILEQNPKIEFKNYEIEIFLMGIYEDTGNLTYTNTTADDVKMAAYLIEKGASLDLVNSFVSKSLTEKQRDLFLEFISHGKIIEKYGENIFLSLVNRKEFIDGIDVITNKIKDIYAVDAVFTVFSDKDRIYIIARSSSNYIKVNDILEKFGGGGHYNAGAAVIKNGNINEIIEELIESIDNIKENGKKAQDIMQFPVKTVKLNVEIKEAYKILLRFGYNSLPIIDEAENLKGIISRREIDKAILHGFTNAPVRAYMSSNFFVCKQDTSVEKLKEILIKNEISSIPIVDLQGKIIGIITRGDVLRALYEKKYNLSKNQNIASEIIKKSFGRKILNTNKEIFDSIKTISKNRGEKVFLVGGIVRDLILGIENFDIDIVVEGNGIEFANELFLLLNGKKIIVHDKFHTAVIMLKNNIKLDVATSRIEYYEYPTSMPIVEKGSIKQDLFRRDFTINAMALEIDFENFGRLIDIFNGYKDLKEKKIRILHNFSFIEDPTRIIRAIRFSVRYGFNIEEDTEKFIKDCVEAGFIQRLSLKRIKNELEIIFNEKNSVEGTKMLAKYGILKSINKKIHYTKEIESALLKLKNNINLVKEYNVKIWIIHFLILIENLEHDEIVNLFNHFSFKQEFITKYSFGKNNEKEIREKIKNSLSDFELYAIMKMLALEIIFVMLFIEEEKIVEKIKYYFNYLCKIEPIITGKDIIDMGYKGNKSFKIILEQVLEKQINEKITDRQILLSLLNTKCKNILGGEKSEKNLNSR